MRPHMSMRMRPHAKGDAHRGKGANHQLMRAVLLRRAPRQLHADRLMAEQARKPHKPTGSAANVEHPEAARIHPASFCC